MMGKFFDLLFGKEGGPTKSEITEMAFRNSFSKYLPYRYYDNETGLYINVDDTIGYIFLCQPLTYAGNDAFKTIASLFGGNLPEDTVLQFTLIADDFIEPIIDKYKEGKDLEDEIIKIAIDGTSNFFKEGTRGIHELNDVPVKNHFLLVSVKMPSKAFGIKNDFDKNDIMDYRRDDIKNVKSLFIETLKGAYLFPLSVDPEMLVRILGRIFNDQNFYNIPKVYNDNVPINKQIIYADTDMNFRKGRLKAGKAYWKCITPKSMAEYVDNLTLSECLGGIWGFKDNNNQLLTPFIFTVTAIVKNMAPEIHTKTSFVLNQKAFSSMGLAHQRKQNEFIQAAADVTKGLPYTTIIPVLWVKGEDENHVREATERAKRLFSRFGFTMQEEKLILKILWCTSLPFGFYNHKPVLDMLQRDFICSNLMASKCLPIQGDFPGGQSANMLLLGRKGQVICMDLFDKSTKNYNGFIAAGSGGGKSFFCNYLLLHQLAQGAKIRCIDIGSSYKRLCNILNTGKKKAQFLSFKADSGICLNPFSNIEDINEDINIIASIITQMIFSSTPTLPDENEATLIKMAIMKAYRTKGQDAWIDDVYDFLVRFPQDADDSEDRNLTGNLTANSAMLQSKAQSLAFNMQDFLSTGMYGKWFNGKSNLDLSHLDLAVLELEELAQKQELFRVVLLQIMNYLTYEMYLSNRMIRKIMLFDESWQFMQGGTDGFLNNIANVIETAYRRSRKYNGSCITVTQGIMDTESFGRVGKVIMANSNFKFYLESTQFQEAADSKVLDYDPFIVELLKSVKSIVPNYSEIFIDSAMGKGVARLVVNPHMYYMFTSHPTETQEIDDMVASGMSFPQAIESMVQKYRPKREIKRELPVEE
jgi:conjugal transfer ATP-binding protein TraC